MKRPLAAALAFYALASAVLLAISVKLTRGELVFPLDDAYIHFAIARTLVEHHAYGLQPGAFSTPASSLLWPLLLAGARALGIRFEITALALGLASGAATLAIVDRVLTRAGATARYRLVALVAIGALIPLVPMALLGMEHALHMSVVLALVAATFGRSRAVAIALLAALAVALRYESAFVVAALVAVVTARGDRSRSLAPALLLGGSTPVALAAAFFVAHGAPPFPASVVLKRTHASLLDLPGIVAHRFIENPHVPGLLVALGLAAYVARTRRDDAAVAWTVVAAGALLGQATLAQLGWLYRYESYAVALALVALALAFRREPPRPAPRAIALAAAIALAPTLTRSAFAHSALPRASRNVSEQQAQVAQFVRTAAPAGAVAVNDVGAVAFFGKARVLDLLGLADLRVARARGMRIDAPLAASDIDRFAREDGVRLAVLYEPWFAGAIPAGWVPLERWRIHDNRVCAFDTVTFFATAPDVAGELRHALDAYRPQLPRGVDALPILP